MAQLHQSSDRRHATLMMRGPSMAGEHDIKADIATELYKALQALGAKPDLLKWIGSYGDTRTDEEVLDGLRKWNALSRPSWRVRRQARAVVLAASPFGLERNDGGDSRRG
jgi:hypothetical protein